MAHFTHPSAENEALQLKKLNIFQAPFLAHPLQMGYAPTGERERKKMILKAITFLTAFLAMVTQVGQSFGNLSPAITTVSMEPERQITREREYPQPKTRFSSRRRATVGT